jgi:hypothetical protein
MKLSTALRRAAERSLHYDRIGYLHALLPVWSAWIAMHREYVADSQGYLSGEESCTALLLLAEIAEGEGR